MGESLGPLGSERARLPRVLSCSDASHISSLLEEESDTWDNLRIVSVTWLTVRTGRRPHMSLLPLEDALAREMCEAVRGTPTVFGEEAAAALMFVRLRPRRTTSVRSKMSDELPRRLATLRRSPASSTPPAPPSASIKKARLAALEMKL